MPSQNPGMMPPQQQAPAMMAPQAGGMFPQAPGFPLQAPPSTGVQGGTDASSDGGTSGVQGASPAVSNGVEKNNIPPQSVAPFFSADGSSSSLSPPPSQTFPSNGAVSLGDTTVGSRVPSIGHLFSSSDSMTGPGPFAALHPREPHIPNAKSASGGPGEHQSQETFSSFTAVAKGSFPYSHSHDGRTTSSPCVGVQPVVPQLNGIVPKESNSQGGGVASPPIRTSPFQASGMLSPGVGAQGAGGGGVATQGKPPGPHTMSWPRGPPPQAYGVPSTNGSIAGEPQMMNVRPGLSFSTPSVPSTPHCPSPPEAVLPFSSSQPPSVPFAFPRPPSFLVQTMSQGNPSVNNVFMGPGVSEGGITFSSEKQDNRDMTLLHSAHQGEVTGPVPPPRSIRW